MDVNFSLLLIGFIVGTFVSVNALYVLFKFFIYVRYRVELKKKKVDYSKNKDNFNNEFNIKLDE